MVLTTKYRKKVITPAILTRLTELIQHISQKWGCEVIEFNGEVDHVHLLFRYYPQMQLSKFVNALKSYTSQIIRKEFLAELKQVYWGKPVFWNGAYFVASCGGVTVEVLKQYVQSQNSPAESEQRKVIPPITAPSGTVWDSCRVTLRISSTDAPHALSQGLAPYNFRSFFVLMYILLLVFPPNVAKK